MPLEKSELWAERKADSAFKAVNTAAVRAWASFSSGFLYHTYCCALTGVVYLFGSPRKRLFRDPTLKTSILLRRAQYPSLSHRTIHSQDASTSRPRGGMPFPTLHTHSTILSKPNPKPRHKSNFKKKQFFTTLTTLLSTTSQKARGSIFLTQKPLLNTDTTNSSSTPSILIRATDGNTNAPNPKPSKAGDAAATKSKKPSTSQKVKLSTVVAPEELEAFYAKYAEVCKAGMTGLKKRDRKRGKAKGKGGAGKVAKA